MGESARTVRRPMRSTVTNRCRRQLRYAGGNGVGQLSHGGRTVASEIRHRNIGLAEGNPAVRGQAVMGYTAMPLA